jgi:hypothetical protein
MAKTITADEKLILLHKKLSVHEKRLHFNELAIEVYQLLVTDEERRKVGSFAEATRHREGTSIGMWMRAKQVSRHRAIIDLARHTGMPESEYDMYLRLLGEARVPVEMNRIPVWDRATKTLSFDGVPVKVFKRNALSQIPLLEAFQKQNWVPRIISPLKKTGKTYASTRLRDAVKLLNRGQGQVKIKFERDGTKVGVCWYPPK